MVLLRSVKMLSRQPMIQFRFGVRESAAALSGAHGQSSAQVRGAAAAPAAGRGGAAGGAAIFASVDDLPRHLRPVPITDEEAEAVRLGGAAPYSTAAKKKK
jgi:hypothetical protein